MTPVISGVSSLISVTFRVNDIYNFDGGAVFGGKQPLYYDMLLSSNGPYRQYKVHSCKLKMTFINASSDTCTIFVTPALAASAECDTSQEAENFPRVIKRHLTGNGGSCDKLEIVSITKPTDVYPTSFHDVNFLGAYNGSPSTVVYQNILIPIVSTSEVDIAIEAVFDVTLSYDDAVIS